MLKLRIYNVPAYFLGTQTGGLHGTGKGVTHDES
jgi:hypothetical protein